MRGIVADRGFFGMDSHLPPHAHGRVAQAAADAGIRIG